MEMSMSRILVETVVRRTLKELKEDPERSIRKLIDLALEVAEGRFQQEFLQAARIMLENEDSPYYGLVRDVVSYAGQDKLFRLGMNLGYNSCTEGARRIRDNQNRLGIQIPWCVRFQLDGSSGERLPQYQSAVKEGEKLGIYAWLLEAPDEPAQVFPLIQAHPDSAFFLFCRPGAVTARLADGIGELDNLLPVIQAGEGDEPACVLLRDRGIPYNVYSFYGPEDLPRILDGRLLSDCANRLRPLLTALVPRRDCTPQARVQAWEAARQARNGQLYQTLPWEMEGDTGDVAQRISGRNCPVCFDSRGKALFSPGDGPNLFQSGLLPVLKDRSGKKEPAEKA
ncbi:MAG: hypothetical protein LUD69_01760 [Oscillospiraceae bacterium]|nr:hypothetical protein [Oscillospiraceae bacterium]